MVFLLCFTKRRTSFASKRSLSILFDSILVVATGDVEFRSRRTTSSSCLTHDDRAVLFHRRILVLFHCYLRLEACCSSTDPIRRDKEQLTSEDLRSRDSPTRATFSGEARRQSASRTSGDNGNLEIRLHMTETHNTEGRRQYRIPRYPATRVPTTASMETRVTASPTGHTLQTASQAEKAYGFKVYCSTSLLAGISRDPSIQFETAYSGSFTHHRKSSP